MSVVLIARMRNEIKHVRRFCSAYDWVDKMIIADGGSVDGTLDVLAQFKNVEVHHFDEVIWRNNISWNPEGRQINFAIKLAEAQNPDWIILDEADSALSPALRKDGPKIFQEVIEDTVFVHRLYIWGTTKWFPDLTGGSLNPSPDNWFGLWAWRPQLNVRWEEDPPWVPACKFCWEERSRRNLSYPYALLHYFCIDEEEVERKLRLYRDTGIGSSNMRRWDQSCGRMEDLPKWAIPDYVTI